MGGGKGGGALEEKVVGVALRGHRVPQEASAADYDDYCYYHYHYYHHYYHAYYDYYFYY